MKFTEEQEDMLIDLGINFSKGGMQYSQFIDRIKYIITPPDAERGKDAKSFLEKYIGPRPSNNDWIVKKGEVIEKLLTEFAASETARLKDKLDKANDTITELIRQVASLRPAQISEEEIDKASKVYASNNTSLARDFYEAEIICINDYKKGARWALSKQSSIVLPEYVAIDYDQPVYFRKKAENWNALLDRIKYLNPSAVFVTGQNEEK